MSEEAAVVHQQCECMEIFEKTVVEKQVFNGLKVTAARFDRAMIWQGNTVKSRPLLEVELTVEGRKSPVRRSVVYSFCPFCGKAYEKLKDGEVSNV